MIKHGEWDPSGERLVGFGLTSIETPHRVDMGELTMWVWCAPDALGIPSVIGKAWEVQSSCVATGDPIRVHVTPTGVERVEPASAVVSNVSASLIATEGRQRTCAVSNFYRDAEAASDWLAANPNGIVLPVRDHYDLYREVTQRLGAWLEQQTMGAHPRRRGAEGRRHPQHEPYAREEWTYRYLAAAHAWAGTEAAVAERIGAEFAAAATTTAPSAPEPTTAELRAWARAAGITVPDRGRLRPEVWQAWRDAQSH